MRRRQTPPKNDMTIPKKIIELAVAGGWQEKWGKLEWDVLGSNMEVRNRVQGELKTTVIYWQEIVLDLSFWQALGKTLGWTKWGEFDEEYKKNSDPQWQYNAHRFYDLILTNGDTTAFWKDILTNLK